MRPEQKNRLAQLRHWRVRARLSGTADRPRMSVKFTGQHIYVQFIDDDAGRTLAAVSTYGKARPEGAKGANKESALVLGKAAASAALEKGIGAVVFDRGSARYHGKVKALADAAREGGLRF